MGDCTLEEIHEQVNLKNYKIEKAFENLNYAYSETAFAFVGEDNQLALEGFFGAIKNGLVKAAKAVADFFVMIGRWIKGLFIKKKNKVIQEKTSKLAKKNEAVVTKTVQSHGPALKTVLKQVVVIKSINNSLATSDFKSLAERWVKAIVDGNALIRTTGVKGVTKKLGLLPIAIANAKHIDTKMTEVTSKFRSDVKSSVGGWVGTLMSVSGKQDLMKAFSDGVRKLSETTNVIKDLEERLPTAIKTAKDIAANMKEDKKVYNKNSAKLANILLRSMKAYGRLTKDVLNAYERCSSGMIKFLGYVDKKAA